MRKRTTRRLGSSLALAGAVALLLSGARGAGKKKREPESFAVIAGTVFRDSGLALAGAEVTVESEAGAKPAGKQRKLKAASDTRGEFALRVPAAPVRYNVSVRAPGFQPQQKAVSVQGGERIDVFFRLEPAAR